jgi:hypothetical protein
MGICNGISNHQYGVLWLGIRRNVFLFFYKKNLDFINKPIGISPKKTSATRMWKFQKQTNRGMYIVEYPPNGSEIVAQLPRRIRGMTCHIPMYYPLVN